MLAGVFECPEAYVCPQSGETECLCHGGFDCCCSHPDCPGNTAPDWQKKARRLLGRLRSV